MSEFENNSDWLEDFLSNRLNDSEKEAARTKIEKDPILQDELKDLKDIHVVLRLQHRKMMKDSFQELEEEFKQNNYDARSKNPYLKYFIGIAASFLLLIIGYWVLQPGTPNPKELFAANFEVYPNYDNVRNEMKKNAFLEAMHFYEQAEFDQAIPILQRIIEKDHKREDALFYLGVAYLADHQSQEAIKILESLYELPPQTFQNQTTWYLGLAYLQSENVDKSKTYFKELAQESSSFQEKAKEILSKVE